MKKIDIHCHTTNRKQNGVVNKSATLEDIQRNMKKYEIEKTVLLATYFPHKKSGVSNYRMLDWMEGKDEFLFFGSLDFEHYFNQGYNELEELAEQYKLDGIKIYTCYQKIDLHSKEFSRVIDLAKVFCLPMMFHTGYSHSSRKRLGRDSVEEMVGAEDLEFVARQNPDLKIIACHMSKPYLEDLIEVQKRNPNFYTDMSGMINSFHDREEIPRIVDEIKYYLEEIGPGKLLFGTDFPIQTYEDSVYFVEEGMKGSTDEDRIKVYYENALEVLRR